MNLSDRVRGAIRTLADNKKPELDAEIGVSGDFQTLYNQEEARRDTITIEDYRKMRENDGTVNAIYNVMTLPVKACEYHFEVEDGGDKELQFVEDNFTLPPHKGGMTYTFDLLIADLLRSIEDGFRLYEKVLTLNAQKKIVYRKLAPRDASSVTLLRDEHGGFAGATQRTWNGTKYIDVTIPVERCFLFTLGKEKNFLYGESPLKAGYYHYDRKHKLYYLQQLMAQVAGVPPRKLGLPDGVMNNPTKLAAAERAADDFGVMSRITLPPGYTLEEYKSNPYKLTEDINHHDALIARSVLAQFLVLGTQSSGSFALSSDQTEMFTLALKGLMKEIENHINAYVIPDLINYNFGSGKYPEFHFAEIDDTTKQAMAKAWEAILTRQDLPGEVVKAIAKQMADELGLDIEDAPADKNVVKQNSHKLKNKELADNGKFFRKLTDAESKVNLSDIQKRTQREENVTLKEAQTLFVDIKDDALARLRKLLDAGDVKGIKDFELKKFPQYKKIIEQAMMEQYLYGKKSAADELNVKIPQTPQDAKTYISTQAQAVVDKQYQDLLFVIQSEVTKELRTQNLSTDLGIVDVLSRIGTAFGVFSSKNVTDGIAISLIGALNLGRDTTFKKSASDIACMQFSAILDDGTTELCRSLDEKVLTSEEYEASPWIPPLHWGCRSIWVGINKEDSFIPDLDPIPPAPAGYTEPLLSDVYKSKELGE